MVSKDRSDTIKELNLNGLIPQKPIIQGGMAVGVSLSGLASSVANAGGIGVIGTAGIGFQDKDYHKGLREADLRALEKEIKTAKSKTDGIIGVNIMVALSNYNDMVKTAVKNCVDVIFSGAGLPLELPSLVPEDSKTRLVPIVSSLKGVKVIIRSWMNHFKRLPDAFVLEGPKAGGHLGFKSEFLTRSFDDYFDITIPQIREYLASIKEKEIPLIAAGGIFTKKDADQVRHLGADGIQVGTSFVATEECDADITLKEAIINASEKDIEIIKSPVGMPGRAVRNKFLDDVKAGILKPFGCPYQCIKTCDFRTAPYCIAKALFSASKGDMENGFAFAGTNASYIDRITTVEEVISRYF
ncbi:MAG TPA: nitronate monooxygenase family protein [Thermotogota bacterium]|nr:nitronate monooxygenase family protein [Thermotogota bacterium]HPR94988.1 nitronate monooxygenase family protein [Thermotogota bacterium]